VSDKGKQDTRKEAAKLFKVPERKLRKIKEIEESKPEAMEEIEKGTKTINEVHRQVKVEKREEERKKDTERIKTIKSPEEMFKEIKFSTIVIDPPWDWNDEG